ncbi:MAG: L-seryl-tRNA(Sec) selenium transferase [Myxococcales bacterium]|nr:L-seryl-tRNA(Sec) selenium transferase [Myxococcales bacterium]
MLRALPPAHELIGLAATQLALKPDEAHPMVTRALQALREALEAGAVTADREALKARALSLIEAEHRAARQGGLRPVINGTGVVLHTNLGRAPLGARVYEALGPLVTGYATLEFDTLSGQRGHRDAALARRLSALVGCEDAVVVNNCAAAVLIACTAFGAGKRVLVSRGELVEIGGGFRIPEVIASCGASLVEVGTTNKTRLSDFARVMNASVGAILKVHQSNFVLQGFTEAAPRAGLAGLCNEWGVPLIEDLGAGALVDTQRFGLDRETTVREALSGGADLVLASGDKLLGGPQAGLIVGRARFVETLRRHPLMRALRPGRLVLAALDETLAVYQRGEAETALPAVAMMAASAAEVEARAVALKAAVEARGPYPGVNLTLCQSMARVGGGSLPLAALPSTALRVEGPPGHWLAARLRQGWPVSVVGRVTSGAFFVDLRTVQVQALAALAGALAEALLGWRAGEGRDTLGESQEAGSRSDDGGDDDTH